MVFIIKNSLVKLSKRKSTESDLEVFSASKKSRSSKVETTTRSQVKESNGRINTILVIALIIFRWFQVTHINRFNVKAHN